VRKPAHGGKDAFRVALLGDWGVRTTIHRLVAGGVNAFQRRQRRAGLGLDAVFLAGDNFYSRGIGSLDDARWEQLWGGPYRGVGIPFYVALGNHDYGSGLEKAQLQVQKSGTKGFERWICRDANGPSRPGIYFDQWFHHPGLSVQAVFIDTSLLLVHGLRVRKQWAAQLHWLSERLSDKPREIGKRRVVRLVIGHHVVACYGEKESEVKFVNAASNKVGPGGTSLLDILKAKAHAYLAGHAHTVEYIDLYSRDVMPRSGPVHGKVRSLSKPTLIEVISGTGGSVRQKSYWAAPCYYVARLPGFSYIVVNPTKRGAVLSVHFVDCRQPHRPKVIYGLKHPLAVSEGDGRSLSRTGGDGG